MLTTFFKRQSNSTEDWSKEGRKKERVDFKRYEAGQLSDVDSMEGGECRFMPNIDSYRIQEIAEVRGVSD